MPFCCFDASVCAPTNKLCPNDGTPAGCENKLGLALKLAGLKGGSVPAADPMPGVMADARNGFAAPRPRPPVACGRSPTPSVVGPPSPVLAVGKLFGCAERPKLPPRPAVPTPVVGDDTPLRLVPKPAAPLVPDPKPVVEFTPRPALGPSTPGALLLLPVVKAGGDIAAEAALSAGVVGSDCGIGGSASRSDAPKDELGLNALTPAL